MLTADDLPVTVDPTSAVALSVQVADALRQAATDGRLRVGDKLPSSRALATRIGVSRTVTSAAYEQLHAEGWIAGRHGSGTYVTAAPTSSPTPRAVVASAAPESTLVDLAPGAPSVDAFDSAAWRRAWRAAGNRVPESRPQRAGLPDYRAAVAEHLLRHRGLVDQDVVLATSGTSAAAGELARAVLSPGDVVAVEEPGYGRTVGALRAAGMRVHPTRVDRGGLCLDDIPADVRAVYCTPAHQFPTGARMPAARRIALVERARREGWLVIEDDYDSELHYGSAPLPLLAAIGPDVVVHLGTTSKILTPTLGIGWLAAPAHVADRIVDYRELVGTSPAIAGQVVVTEFARSGDLARHLRRVRRGAARRRAAVLDILADKGIAHEGAEAGVHLVIPMPTPAAERGVVSAAAEHGIRVDGLRRHFQGVPYRYGIALGYTACAEEELTPAVEAVTKLIVTEVQANSLRRNS